MVQILFAYGFGVVVFTELSTHNGQLFESRDLIWYAACPRLGDDAKVQIQIYGRISILRWRAFAFDAVQSDVSDGVRCGGPPFLVSHIMRCLPPSRPPTSKGAVVESLSKCFCSRKNSRVP